MVRAEAALTCSAAEGKNRAASPATQQAQRGPCPLGGRSGPFRRDFTGDAGDQLVHRDAQASAEDRQLVELRRRCTGLPFGDSLSGHAHLFGQLLLREALALSKRGDAL